MPLQPAAVADDAQPCVVRLHRLVRLAASRAKVWIEAVEARGREPLRPEEDVHAALTERSAAGATAVRGRMRMGAGTADLVE